MTKQPTNLNSEVTEFLNNQNHPFREEIERLRYCILIANTDLTENIKWNGPNYSMNKEDRITMKILPPKQLQLIFHRGAKKMEEPQSKLIETNSKLLVWKENDRAIVTFKNMQEVEDAQPDIAKIVADWINALK